MKLGDVLKKEREAKGLSVADTASTLGIPEERYRDLEEGRSPAEKWGPLLATIAIKLGTPTARLISETGKSAQARSGECGNLIKKHRERRQKSVEELAGLAELPQAEYALIEKGESPIEEFGPLLLRFAELIEQPIFNLFYPCGLPLAKLEDYP